MGSITRSFANNITTAGKFDGTKLSGDIPEANLSANAPAFDDNKIVNDLSTLGLRVHTQENLTASNTNSQYVDVFQDDSGYTNGANTNRNASEYISSSTIGNKKTLVKAAIYANSTAYAVWQFRASNNATDWTNYGNTMDVSGGSEVNTGTFSNTTAYRYYEFYKTKG